MSFDAHQMDSVLLLGAVVMLAAILAVRVSVGMGLPSLLLYLLMGVLLGEAGLGIEFEDANVAHALGFAALVLILAEGGLTTQWAEIRPVMKHGVALATVGVGVSVTVMAVGAHYLFGLDWQLAVLLGAVTSPTDAAAVFSVLRRVPLPRQLTGVLEAESGLNDAPTVLLVTLVSTGAALDHGVIGFVGIVLYELALGVAGGLLVGFGGAWVMRRVALPSSGLYPIAVLSLTILAYAGSAALHASGFAAVYTAALVLGNSELPHRTATRSFSEGVALAGADRAVRDARPARLARPDLPGARGRRRARRAAAHRGGAAAVGLRLLLRRADGLRGAAVRLLGRPARRRTHRAGHHPARRRGPAADRAVRHRVRDGGDLHAADRTDPAVGGAGAGRGAPRRSRATSRWRRRRWSGSRRTCSR